MNARPSPAARTRRLVHVSDLHFGSPGVEERAKPLLEALAALRPTVVAVSGDLTRRADPAEFRACRAFLDRIEAPVVVVPGNHDVPFAPWVRFRGRHARFLAHVSDDLAPFFFDGHLAVAGIDTTRSFGIDGGRARRGAMRSLAERFGDVPEAVFRVVVAHHPFTRQPGRRLGVVAQKSRRALDAFDALAVDAVLTGHRHESVVARSMDVVRGATRSYLLVQAGTATTYRGRRSEKGRNSFAVLDVGPKDVRCARRSYDPDEGFVEDRVEVHPRAG
jgi:3',5'-cyclic AMP phosphodiesterase CpdA